MPPGSRFGMLGPWGDPLSSDGREAFRAPVALPFGAAVSREAAIIASCLLANFAIALGDIFVTSVLPSIAARLEGVELFGWAVTASSVSFSVTLLAWGRSADVYGRRLPYVVASVLCVVGSLLSAFVPGPPAGMRWLIACRAIYGAGVGGISTVGATMLGDALDLKARSRLQGWIAVVFALTSMASPFAAPLLLAMSWRAIFLLGVPFALASAAILVAVWREPLAPSRNRPPATSVLLVTVSLGGLLTGLALATGRADGASPQAARLLIGVGAAAFLGFVAVERRSANSLVQLGLLRRRFVRAALLCAPPAGIAYVVAISYPPLIVQGVLGCTPRLASLALTCTIVAWTLSCFLGPRLALAYGFRRVVVAGTILLAFGYFGLSRVEPETSYGMIVASLIVVGLALGFVLPPLSVAVQSDTSPEDRASATTLFVFSRMIGSTLGLAIISVLLAGTFPGEVERIGRDRGIAIARSGVTTAKSIANLAMTAGALPPAERAVVQDALGSSLRPAFIVIFVACCGVVFAALTLPRERPSE